MAPGDTVHALFHLLGYTAAVPPPVPPPAPKLISRLLLLRWMLATAVATAVCIYVVCPSVYLYLQSEEDRARAEEMFASKRRVDRYTTGFINQRNDCFANATLQALALLPAVAEYVSAVLRLYQALGREHPDTVAAARRQMASLKDEPIVPIHAALGTMLAQLQLVVHKNTALSVWSLLHVLERAFNARILRNQHDAQELAQLLLETLETENGRLRTAWTKAGAVPKDVPVFPFLGKAMKQFSCLACLRVLRPLFLPFTIMLLPVPDQPSATLDEIMRQNEVELIEDYACLGCRLAAVVAGPTVLPAGASAEEHALRMKEFKAMLADPLLEINADLDPAVDAYLTGCVVGGRPLAQVRLTVKLRTVVVQCPAVFIVHFSRSLYTSSGLLIRNNCKVAFGERILVNQFDDESTDGASLGTLVAPGVVRAVLDAEADGSQSDEDEDATASEASASDPEEDENEVTDAESNSSSEDLLPPATSSVTLADTAHAKDRVVHEPVMVARVKYRLKLVVRHEGSHTRGHYECFRHKPIFVKNDEGVAYPVFPVTEPLRPAVVAAPVPTAPPARRFLRARRPTFAGTDVMATLKMDELARALETPAIETPGQGPLGLAGGVRQPHQDTHPHLRKLALYVKYPYWRISDSKVSEVLRQDVLKETLAAYMLFYEQRAAP